MEIAGTPRNSFRASVARTVAEVEHRIDEGPSPGTDFNRTANAVIKYAAVRLRLIRAVAERETAQTGS